MRGRPEVQGVSTEHPAPKGQQEHFKGVSILFFFLIFVNREPKSNQKKKEGRREQEKKWMGREEKKTDRQTGKSFFFCEKEMQAWGLQADNHRAQQPTAKGFGKLREAGVCLAVKQALPARAWRLPRLMCIT